MAALMDFLPVAAVTAQGTRDCSLRAEGSCSLAGAVAQALVYKGVEL